MSGYNLMDTEWTWNEVERWWKSQDSIKYMWDHVRDCFIFRKADGTFYMDVIEHDFYIVKLDIYLQNLGDETPLTRIWTGPGGSC
jgi:hypothetical protein